MDYLKLLPHFKKLFVELGVVIGECYQNNNQQVQWKADQTPVTQADIASNTLICQTLSQLTPTIPIISEEIPCSTLINKPPYPKHWLVDPLDGTLEFIEKTDEFTVNIALIEKDYPTFGLVYIPMQNTLYYGGKTLGAFVYNFNSKTTNTLPQTTIEKNSPIKIVASRSQLSNTSTLKIHQTIKEHYANVQILTAGSALKGCLLANNQADFYPRNTGTYEWDTAAIQAILEGAKGKVIDKNGYRLRYNKKQDYQNSSFLMISPNGRPYHLFWS